MSPTFVQFCLEPHLWRNFRENIFVSSSGCTRTLYTNRPLMTMRCQNIYLFDSLVNIQGCLYTQQRTLCSVYCVMCMANPYREIMGEFRPDLYILQVYIYTVYCRVGWSVFGEKTATRQFVPMFQEPNSKLSLLRVAFSFGAGPQKMLTETVYNYILL